MGYASALGYAATLAASAVIQEELPSTPVRDASELYENCTAKELDRGMQCYAFIGGVIDGYYLGSGLAEAPLVFCMPDQTTMRESRKVVVDFMKRRPDALNRQAAVVVLTALKEGYPCAKK
ncbi:hypothetical protein GVO57_11040 [Sphingomonas changnyeongensis]|uniref:Rap1a immunity protein domain-containing protein n=1 Tax=Sphingomonas changnyeongensis TaxID=2698679 RepID=A0A7Z2NXB7_9SPHN|nr:Rap1a/Tai family immunity protein [Sphingomonas changnyeongensis]QHL91247.1 hypothetical protein GVO57_11040 [Sphingomonas changnyeongensis]